MENSKRKEINGDVFVCHIEDFESGEISKRYAFHNCLLYLIQSTSYSLDISLATVYYLRNDRVIHDWRARIKDFHRTARIVSLPARTPDSKNGRSSGSEPGHFPKYSKNFFSILDHRGSYRELLETAGPIVAKKLLLRANDASALHAFRPTGYLHRKITSNASLHGLIVSDRDFYTYISLKLIFEERAHGGYRPISELKAHLLTASANSNSSRLELDFYFGHSDTPLALPINVIIGANGVGKTRALLAVAKYMFERQKRDLNFTNQVIVFSHEARRWIRHRSKRIKHISLSIMSSEWKKLPAVTQEISLSRNKSFSLNTLNNILRKVVDTRRIYLKMIGQDDGRSLDELSRFPEMCERIDLSAEYQYIDEFGVAHPFSSGQRAMICFCFNLTLHCAPNSLLLIDEPENHLHPRFISILMQTLHSVLLATESVAIVATHSPFVVREVDRSGVLILKNNSRNEVLLFRPSLQTLGGDISLISDFVFEDLESRKGYQEFIDQALLSCHDPVERKKMLEKFSALGLDAAAYARSLE